MQRTVSATQHGNGPSQVKYRNRVFIYDVLVKDDMSVSLYPITGHKSCKMLSILNKLTLQKELQIFAPKADALPLHYRVN